MPNLVLKGGRLTSQQVTSLMQGIKDVGDELEVFSLSLEEISIEELGLLISTLNGSQNLQELHLMIGRAEDGNPLDDQLITNLLRGNFRIRIITYVKLSRGRYTNATGFSKSNNF